MWAYLHVRLMLLSQTQRKKQKHKQPWWQRLELWFEFRLIDGGHRISNHSSQRFFLYPMSFIAGEMKTGSMGLCSWALQPPPYMQTVFIWKCHSHGKQGFYFYINQQFQMGLSHMGRCILSKSHIRENLLSPDYESETVDKTDPLSFTFTLM